MLSSLTTYVREYVLSAVAEHMSKDVDFQRYGQEKRTPKHSTVFRCLFMVTATSCAADSKSSQCGMVAIVTKISIPDFNLRVIQSVKLAPITPFTGVYGGRS